jgi:hypothetical protein
MQKKDLFAYSMPTSLMANDIGKYIDVARSLSDMYADNDFKKSVNRFCMQHNIGYVYLISGTHNGRRMYKIGKANDVKERLGKFEVKIPFEIDLVYAIRVENPLKIETMLHKEFREFRRSGEWFELDALMLVAVINMMSNVSMSMNGFTDVFDREKANESKLNESDYIDYLESLLAFNGIDFDDTRLRNRSAT